MIDRWYLLIGGTLSLAGLIAPLAQVRGDDTPPPPLDPSIAALPAVDELPNPFTFQDGSPVATPADWDRRRAELKRLFEEYEYGHLPPSSESLSMLWDNIQDKAVPGRKRRTLTIQLNRLGKSLTLHATLMLPKPDHWPIPVLIRPNSYPGASAVTGAKKPAPTTPEAAEKKPAP